MADDFGGGKGGTGGGSGFGLSFGSNTVSGFAGAANDLFAAQGYAYKAKGAAIEKGMYEEAAGFAELNEKYTETATSIKQAQQQRALELSLGSTEAGVAASGFEKSGSALDLLADSASQGSLAHQVLGYQGLITEAGYKQQADALHSQAAAAGVAEEAAKTAETGSYIGAAIKGATAIASIFG